MAGDIKLKYGAATTTVTTTNLQSLASSATKTVGWISAGVSNLTNVYQDYLYSAEFKSGTSPTANTGFGTWLYAPLNDTPTYASLFSAGTAGTEGTATCFGSTATNVRDAQLRPLLVSATVDAVTNRLTGFSQLGIAAQFGSSMPTHHGLYVSQDTGATSASSGNVVYYTPVISQYT